MYARFLARNCNALANKLATLADGDIVTDHFVDLRDKPKADALGVAVLSHLIPGLQFDFNVTDKPSYGVRPLVNGMPATFEEAATIFFGEDVRKEVFLNTGLTRTAMINRLRYHANQYSNDGSA